jgi:uncharacterized glyoxalase superfamily protein PhnB
MAIRKLVPSLGVAELPRSIAWYHDVFGFEVLQAFDGERGLAWCHLKSGQAELMLQQLTDDQISMLRQPASRSWVMYLSPESIDALHRRLRDLGMEVTDLEPTSYGTLECFMTDPDGYEIWMSAPGVA